MIQQPIKGFVNEYYPKGSVTQYFGENPALYGKICSGSMCLGGHNGIDIVAPWGTPIYAVEGGVVCDVKESPDGYGKFLRILTQDKTPNAINREWTYGHNSVNHVKVGDVVKAGDHICNMGNTGFVVSGATPFWKHNPYAGTHLHLGMREFRYDSTGWAYPSGDKVYTLNVHNGYMGSLDFAHLLPTQTVTVNEEAKKRELLLTAISLANQLLTILRAKK